MGLLSSSDSVSTSISTDRRQAASDDATNIGENVTLAPDGAIATGGAVAITGGGIQAVKSALTVERVDDEVVQVALAEALGFADQALGFASDRSAESQAVVEANARLVEQVLAGADPEPAAAAGQTLEQVSNTVIILAIVGAVGLFAFRSK